MSKLFSLGNAIGCLHSIFRVTWPPVKREVSEQMAWIIMRVRHLDDPRECRIVMGAGCAPMASDVQDRLVAHGYLVTPTQADTPPNRPPEEIQLAQDILESVMEPKS